MQEIALLLFIVAVVAFVFGPYELMVEDDDI